MPKRELIKLLMEDSLAKTYAQFPFWPPTDISIVLALFFHSVVRAAGKFYSSIMTVPSGLVLANARIIVSMFGLTSFVFDWPQ